MPRLPRWRSGGSLRKWSTRASSAFTTSWNIRTARPGIQPATSSWNTSAVSPSVRSCSSDGQSGQSLPVAQALAYAIEVLPALAYLHRRGLVYCDFKPDNVIQVEEQLKLIDLGGVRRIADDDSPIYGTVGYQAPEVAAAGPSPASDLYSVGRALAVLTFEFVGYTSTMRHHLPDPATVPVLASHESFYRLLCRATEPDPRRRFTAAADMITQLTGVLREVLAAADGIPRPTFSGRFTPEVHAIGSRGMTGADNATGSPSTAEIIARACRSRLSTAPTLRPATWQRWAPLSQSRRLTHFSPRYPPPRLGTAGGVADSVEAYLGLARARIATGDAAGAGRALNQLIGRGRADWRRHLVPGSRRCPGRSAAGGADSVRGCLRCGAWRASHRSWR